VFKLNVAKLELIKHDKIIMKLSPIIALIPTSFEYSLKKSIIKLFPFGIDVKK